MLYFIALNRTLYKYGLGHNSATSPEYRSAGCEGFDAASAWAGVEESVIQNVVDHQRSHLRTCIQPQKDMNIHCDKN